MKKVKNYARFIDAFMKGDMIVEVWEAETTYSAWLTQIDNSVKEYMFGLYKDSIEYDTFLAIVEANLPEHISMYKCNYGI